MVYVIPITLPVPISKIPFLRTQIHKIPVRNSYFVPFEPIEWLENLKTRRLESVSQILCMCPSQSFIAKLWEGEKSFTNF